MTKPQVDYELVVYDELPPPAARGASGGGKSVLNEQLDRIKATPEAHGKPARIALYSKGTAATAAKNVLQQRFGRTPAVEGWKFYTRPVPLSEEPNADVHKGLFAIFTPDAVVEGAREAHDAAEERRKARLAAEREEREAAMAEAGEDPEDGDEDEEDEDAEDEDEDLVNA